MSPAIEFPDRETRARLRSEVLDAIALHRARHPLQQQIEAAEPARQRAYLAPHEACREERLAAQLDALDPATRAWLQQIAAIHASTDGWNCPPFTSIESPFIIETASTRYHAASAIDALAMPALLGCDGTLHGHCRQCGVGLSHRINRQGGLDELAIRQLGVITDPADSAAVPDTRRPPSWLICADCPPPDTVIRLPLPPASTIGNAFYGFIGRLRCALHNP